MTSDDQLVTSVVGGDAAAYGRLVERYEQSLRAVAFFIIRDLHLAEDVVQDAFIAAYRNLPSLRTRSAFGPWIMQIVRQASRTAARRRPHTVPLDRAAEIATTGESPELDSEQQLLAAIMKLSESERLTLMLRHFDGHDTAAIAQITGESLSTVTKRISRAHAHLRQLLKEDPR